MAYETVSDLIKVFRDDEKDLVDPYFWSDGQLVRFTNGALAAFAERTKSIIGDGIEVEFTAGEDEIEYPAYIIDVIDAELFLGERSWSIDVRSPAEIRRSRLPTTGRPCVLLANSAVGRMRLVPKPRESGKVVLQAIRRPIKELAKDSKLVDVNPVHREYLLLFIKHRAYNVKDAEIFDAVKAGQYLAEFNYECQRIYEDELRRRGGARSIRYRG
ncbi:hypothetical protein N619_01075 [Ectopseudomonas oleovorans]|nr:hypothetical protein N619_01075 [Pseudomonas oleovorans]